MTHQDITRATRAIGRIKEELDSILPNGPDNLKMAALFYQISHNGEHSYEPSAAHRKNVLGGE